MLKLHPVSLILGAVAAAVLGIAGTVLAVGGDTASIDSLGYTRACAMTASPWTALDTNATTAVYTAALTVGQRYVIQCDSDTIYNPAAVITGADAAADGDGWIPAGAWYDHIVFTATPYVSLLNATVDTRCRYALCK